MISTLIAILLAAPGWTQHANFKTPDGAVIDCKTLRATKPGEVLTSLGRYGLKPQNAFRALEICFAEGPHVCDEAWVGYAIFGGLSMAVVDGGAQPFDERKARFAVACRGLSPEQQACVKFSSRKVGEGAPPPSPVCAAAREALNTALGKHRNAAQLKRKIRAPRPKSP